jgi:Caspase domain
VGKLTAFVNGSHVEDATVGAGKPGLAGCAVERLCSQARRSVVGNRSALMIANDQYSDGKLGRLRSPSIDAARLARVLGDPSIGNFAVMRSTNDPESGLRRKLSAFFRGAAREDVLLLHIACHGVKDDDGNLYFATVDTDTSDLLTTAISAEFVKQLLDRTSSRRIVLLLDCCYSGAFARGTRGDPNVQVLERLRRDREQFDGRGRAVLTASNAMEYAWEGDDIQGEGVPSVFTGAVISGLETGDADGDGDGQISVDDLYEYVLEKVRASGARQTPNKLIQLQGELVLARSVRGPRSMHSLVPAPEKHQERGATPEDNRRVAALYERSVRYALAEEWQQALETLEEVERLRPGFRDVESRLSTARSRLRQHAP